MNVPRFVDVTMSTLPSLLRSVAVTWEPTPDLLWINSGTNSAPPGARELRTVRNTVEHRLAVRVRIDPALLVREQPLPCHEIGNAIAIDVGHRRAVHLRDGDAAGVLRRIVVDDHVPLERDLSCRVALLLEPGEPESMGIQTRRRRRSDGRRSRRTPPSRTPPAPFGASPSAEGVRVVRPQT